MPSITSVEIDPNFGARLQQLTILSVVEIIVAHTRASAVSRATHAAIDTCDISAEVHQRLASITLVLDHTGALKSRERGRIAFA